MAAATVAACEVDGYAHEHEHAEQHELRAEGDLLLWRQPVSLLLHVVAVVVALGRAHMRLRLLPILLLAPATPAPLLLGRHPASLAQSSLVFDTRSQSPQFRGANPNIRLISQY
eukprot:scaffold83465_cov39-Phaeocystis_antarctica.AAC.1